MNLFPVIIVAIICNFIHSSNCGTISSELLSKLRNGQKADAILELPSVFGKVMSNPSLTFLSGADKANMMETLMKQSTSASQAPFMAAINRLGISDSATPFWISNDISLTNINLGAIQSLGALPGVFNLREQFVAKLDPVVRGNRVSRATFNETIQKYPHWGVDKIQAPAAWSRTKGENVLVAIIDTGVYMEHEALRDGYAGKWLDATFDASTSPIDPNSHGTHALGTILGRTNNIGVAPRAKWIACRGMNQYGGGLESWIKTCAQWVYQQRPGLVSNSWATATGGTSTSFDDIIKSWRAVGIIPVFASGNSGDNCGSAEYPGNHPDVISVGSTRKDDGMSGFSSRGPSPKGLVKPQIAAPGSFIVSAGNKDPKEYKNMSGTSMACPHAAGVVALLLSANPSWKYDDVLQALTRTAERPPITKECGNSNTTSYPNNAYGYGRINAKRAIGL
ncbi:bacillopeptidase F [Folsomia candida]|uniref:Bacillopeptidase F n=1 Tax=Folsomia candida TaxID=158441 RepID=A0A226D0T1_FOLCA|nr:bacillopeptidase F [Folsomia candida]OXA38261.1 Bacillopeptidase F [Folsomia candida]